MIEVIVGLVLVVSLVSVALSAHTLAKIAGEREARLAMERDMAQKAEALNVNLTEFDKAYKAWERENATTQGRLEALYMAAQGKNLTGGGGRFA